MNRAAESFADLTDSVLPTQADVDAWNAKSIAEHAVGEWNVATNTPNPTTALPNVGDYLTVTVAGTSAATGTSVAYEVGDRLIKTQSGLVRIPKADLGLAKAQALEPRVNNLDTVTGLLSPQNQLIPVIRPVASYAYSTYTALDTFKEQLTWYFAKSAKTIRRIGVFIFKRTSQGTITHNARLQVLHRRSGVTTVLLDKTILAADLAVYNNADSIVDYRNYEYQTDLTTPMALVAGDELFVSLSCDDYLNPVYSATDKLLATGEWNDGTNTYRQWGYNLPPTRTTIPAKVVDVNYHALHFYDVSLDVMRIKNLETSSAALQASVNPLLTLPAQVDSNTKSLAAIDPQILPIPVIQPVPSYALTTYTTVDTFKEQMTWYFVKAAKRLDRIGVFIHKRSSSPIANTARLQVLHRRGTTVTILLDKTISVAEMAGYNTPNGISDYRNYEYLADLTTPISALAGDELFVSLSCNEYLNPIYSATDRLLASGEWNDGVNNYRFWNYSLPGTRTTFPDKSTRAESNYHAINWYQLKMQSVEINSVKARVSALEALNPSNQDYPVIGPTNIYVPNTDTFTGRREAVRLYLQRLIRTQLPVWINAVGQNSLIVSKKAVNTAAADVEPLSLTVKGPGYMDKVLNFNRVSVKSSVLETRFPKLHWLGDSITENRRKNGVLAGAGAAWSMCKEIALKNRTDKGSGYDLLCVGTKFQVSSDINYAGQTLNVNGFGSGMGGWAAFNYLRHPIRMHINPAGAWALLGLLTSQGRAYAASAADNILIAKTIYGVTAPVINKDSYDLLITTQNITNELGAWTGTAAQIQKVQDWINLVAANNLNTEASNPYFDITKSGNNRFSISAYLNRYKTLADDGVTRLVVGTTAGSRVTNVTAWDVCTPTHVVICLGENDRTFYSSNYALICDDMMELAAEWTSALPAAKVAYCLTSIPGPMHPERFPDYLGSFSQYDHGNKFDFYSQMITRFGTLAQQVTARTFLLETWHVMTPASHMIVSEQVDPGTDGIAKIGDPDAVHPGYYALREAGVQLYGWLAYTYTT